MNFNRVYVDTSVFGGIIDDEFKIYSLKFFELKIGIYSPLEIISDQKAKKYNCVEEKHKAADRINKITSKLSAKDELEFWKAKTESLLKKQQSLRTKPLKDFVSDIIH